jgi:hypothetical protein
MIDFMANPTSDFIPHDSPRNLGTANSRSKPWYSKYGGYYPRRPSRFTGSPRETMPDYDPEVRKMKGMDYSKSCQNLKKTTGFLSLKRRFLRVC